MGGIIIFTAIAVPFLLLTDLDDWRAIGVFGAAVACALLGFADTTPSSSRSGRSACEAHEARRHDG